MVCVRMVDVSYVMKGLWKMVHFLLHCGEFAGDR